MQAVACSRDERRWRKKRTLIRVTNERGNSMFKLVRLSAAALLGLLMAITLLVPGAFAQRVDARQGSTPSVHQIVTQPLSTNCGGCGWDDGWGGGWGGGW
jgi:hypothetical protein